METKSAIAGHRRRWYLAGLLILAVGALYESSYDRADFFVSQRDYALLEVRFYRTGAAEPFKVTRFPRSDMIRQDGHTLPLRVIFLNHERRTRAERATWSSPSSR